MKQSETNFTPKNAIFFECIPCSFVCSKKSDYNRHISTRKHKNETYETNMKQYFVAKNAKKHQNTPLIHECEYCANIFKSRTTLWRHRKICNVTDKSMVNNQQETTKQETTKQENQNDFKEIVLMLLKENKEFQKTFVEMMPHVKGNTEHSYNNTNSHNTNNFNIQMFLNEKCKNAMNITDFIDSLPVTAETFDNTIENGLTKSITTMITNGLNNMDVLERPIHCTDVNRKTLYVKDNDAWEKDNEMKHLLDGIKDLSIKQRVNISKWHDANEGWETNANLQTRLSTLVFHTMEDIENNDKEIGKIIRAVSKNTYLTQDMKNMYK